MLEGGEGELEAVLSDPGNFVLVESEVWASSKAQILGCIEIIHA